MILTIKKKDRRERRKSRLAFCEAYRRYALKDWGIAVEEGLIL